MAAAEYAVPPSALWRDVLPTSAHRWLVQQPGRIRALDCTPLDQESGSVPWLTGNRIGLLGPDTNDCTEPHLAGKLAAAGYTHLLVRRAAVGAQPAGRDILPQGFRTAASFPDGRVFAVTAVIPPIYTARTTGLFARERDTDRSWQWMGSGAAWTIVNTGARTIVATLTLELAAFHQARHLDVLLDRRQVAGLLIEPRRRTYQVGPLTVTPGEHALVFHPAEPATVASGVIDNGDTRALSFQLGAWDWSVRGEPR
jgi:hypothetical protein